MKIHESWDMLSPLTPCPKWNWRGGGQRGAYAPLVVKCFIFCLMNIKNTQVLTHRLTIRIHPYHEGITSGATIKIALSF